jgi:hypothetical protein
LTTATEIINQLDTAPMYTWADLQAWPALPPASPGIYAWFFQSVPPVVPCNGCIRRQGHTLLYVGIAPSRQSSRATLRSRILGNHFGSNAEGSTLRRTLGCLFEKQLGTTLRLVGSGTMTFAAKETTLTAWMTKNAAVAWGEVQAPWRFESQILHQLPLPLNITNNAHHPFCSQLRAVRAEAAA